MGASFNANITLREKCPYSELFWSVFSLIRTEHKEIRISRSVKYKIYSENVNIIIFSCTNFELTSIKQTTLTKQGSTDKIHAMKS